MVKLQKIYSDPMLQNLKYELGAKVSGSVSKNTDYIIYGEMLGLNLLRLKNLGLKRLAKM